MADTHPGDGKAHDLKQYWAHGAGAARIRWGQPGDFERCRTEINGAIERSGRKPLPDREISGLCSNLHKEATGARPGHAPSEKRNHG
ncbi:hypothetical protein [Mycobacterium sp. PSTR-4-N]|uniref:hypothetical protein n=1 Tax=Mycobacterium sp. PSTR-4-N TaxID=2917745 RepID=UPI001F14A4E9|nr:hypothetical protein [Mycobacterium sp. PSTR-4-N]MCG7592400.1 hypothetical protein [Mycobacterium sp. PSTR-4-N]